MDAAGRLFRRRRVYDEAGTEALFLRAMGENVKRHYARCPEYRAILDSAGFSPEELRRREDLAKLPFLTTLYLKRHVLLSVPERKLLVRADSSGTGGTRSRIGFDLRSLWLGLLMVIRVGRQRKLWSLKPANYVVFGYPPGNTGASKTAYGFTWFAPALRRTYALERTGDGGYALSWDKVIRELKRCSRSPFPLRTMGFPAYTYFLLRELKERGIRCPMPRGSLVALGGGWKQFYAEKVDKEDFYALVKDVLDIDENRIVEFFGAVEHPVLYADCPCHRFHVPVYSRVIIRSPEDFSPAPDGQPGLVNLLTPMMQSVPLSSVMTDDLGILHREPCPCGAGSPWLEILGRVGIRDIVTCAAGAEEYLKGEKEAGT
ncbi:MAG: acyl-protein synthetase [Oscillospiraceae bacterium]|nr:acyl-protein synthetase [Oscillospiraceae bacterium]